MVLQAQSIQAAAAAVARKTQVQAALAAAA